MRIRRGLRRGSAPALLAGAILALVILAGGAYAHPLGNFTINHFARVEIGLNQIQLRFVVDMAEISTIQQLQSGGAVNASKPTRQELDSYLARAAEENRQGLIITLDGQRLELSRQSMSISLLPGAGELNTLRIECGYLAELPRIDRGHSYQLRLDDTNHMGRIGWHEIVIQPGEGITIFDSSAFGNAVTDELKAYPQDAVTAPLDERSAQLSFTAGSMSPAGSRPLQGRDGRQCVRTRDRLAELIAVPEITPGIVLLGLLLAAGLGGLHALSPGHGKTVVGAYLVGSRGTARHAAFLGLTVTVTHTAGVFALGLVTLLASQYIVPERLFPFLSLISGGIVVGIGLSLFLKRLRAALRARSGRGAREHHQHEHSHDHAHGDHDHDHNHHNGDRHHKHDSRSHSHAGHSHSHLPPGADGSRISGRSLLALGISGGMLPCPSALVVLLASISLHRVGYGLLLVIAFSFGLASVLTAVGLLFVYAGRIVKSRSVGPIDYAARLVPVLSAFVITCAGAAICCQALSQAGLIWQR